MSEQRHEWKGMSGADWLLFLKSGNVMAWLFMDRVELPVERCPIEVRDELLRLASENAQLRARIEQVEGERKALEVTMACNRDVHDSYAEHLRCLMWFWDGLVMTGRASEPTDLGDATNLANCRAAIARWEAAVASRSPQENPR